MRSKPIRIAMVAGELSGDLLAAALVHSLRQHLPQADIFGIGGENMKEQGFESWWPMEKLSVNGYIEVLKHYREISNIRKLLQKKLLKNPPDLFIGVDAPDFNLGLEAKLKQAGIPTIHYVSPSIWAWRGERIKYIKKAVSHVLALFPMEAPLYEKEGIPVSYVGHPFADEIPMSVSQRKTREILHLDQSKPIFAFLPGSRQSELKRMADTFIQTAKLVYESLPNAQILVPLGTRETRDLFEMALYKNEAQDLPIRVMFGHSRQAIAAADCVLVASGTATLEAMLIKRPMVIVYRVPRSTYSIVKHKLYLPYVGLPNILAGRFVVPELLQEDAEPENITQVLLNLYEDKKNSQYIKGAFDDIHKTLRQNTAEKAALVALQYIESK